MRNSDALFHRIDVRAWLLALALGWLSLSVDAAGVNSGNVGRFGLVQNGRSASITTGAPPVNSGGSTIPAYPTVGGWTAAGNYGVPPAAQPAGMTGTLMADGRVYFRQPNGHNLDGVNYPLRASTPIPWGAVAGAGAAIICTIGTAGACGVAGAAAAAMPYFMDWMQRGGLSRNPDTGQMEKPDIDPSWPVSDGYLYKVSGQSGSGYASRESACQAWVPAQDNGTFRNEFDHVTTTGGASGYGNCFYRQYRKSNNSLEGTYFVAFSRSGPSTCPSGYYVTPFGCNSAANLPKIAVGQGQIVDMLGNVTPDSRVWGEVLNQGGTIEMPEPTVTGPSSVQGPETVTQNADGSRTVSQTTNNFTTNNNVITNTTNVTTTTTYNSSNVQTGQTVTTTTPSDSTPGGEQDKEDACTKHPEALGCQKIDFDTPDGEIPRDTHTVTYQEESLFGAGSCPTDRYLGLSSTGQSLRIVPWSDYCAYLLPIRGIVMALALFGAFLILMPSRGEA